MRKVIITREHQISQELQLELLKNDFFPCHIPLIHCSPYDVPKKILEHLDQTDWIFFTSAVAFEFFYPYISGKVKIATVGPATSEAVRKKNLRIDFEASHHYARDFAEEWLTLELPKQTILLPQSALSNQDLTRLLSNRGHEVITWSLYGTEVDEEGQRKIPSLAQEPNLIWTFASPSAWKSFVAGGGTCALDQEIAVIGKSTEHVITESGYVVAYMPEEPSVEKMIQKIIQQNRIPTDRYEQEKD